MFRLAAMALFAGSFAAPIAAVGAADNPPALNFTMKSLDGKAVDLERYRGKVVMIVNVASKCGLTPQYKPLEALYKRFEKEGLVVLGFPCDQFSHQEPGSADEIRKFCTDSYGVTFPLFAKTEVNGEGACDLYKFSPPWMCNPRERARSVGTSRSSLLAATVQWLRFAPQVRPDDRQIVQIIEAELAKR